MLSLLNQRLSKTVELDHLQRFGSTLDDRPGSMVDGDENLPNGLTIGPSQMLQLWGSCSPFCTEKVDVDRVLWRQARSCPKFQIVLKRLNSIRFACIGKDAKNAARMERLKHQQSFLECADGSRRGNALERYAAYRWVRMIVLHDRRREEAIVEYTIIDCEWSRLD